MNPTRLLAILVCVLSISASALAQNIDPPSAGHPAGHPGAVGGHFADGHGAWAPHPAWQGGTHFNTSYWHGGHWWHVTYGGRVGWWWIVGPDWYWYPAAVYPYPDPYTPPDTASGTGIGVMPTSNTTLMSLPARRAGEP